VAYVMQQQLCRGGPARVSFVAKRLPLGRFALLFASHVMAQGCPMIDVNSREQANRRESPAKTPDGTRARQRDGVWC
jgi:hypothetical protein